MGTYYHDEGRISEARELFSRAAEVDIESNNVHNTLFLLRSLLILPQVPSSYENMVDERRRLVRDLHNYVKASPIGGGSQSITGILDRTVFYIQYHGFNDRDIQYLISEAYRKNIHNFESYNTLINPSLDALKSSVQGINLTGMQPRKIKVGFVSKFFGVFEPHAFLLDGIMRYLPRSAFEVIAFPVSRNDGKPLAPGIAEGADVVTELSMNHADAMKRVSEAQLDVLVFADTQSEPMTHFMCHNRIAPVQVCFITLYNFSL